MIWHYEGGVYLVRLYQNSSYKLESLCSPCSRNQQKTKDLYKKIFTFYFILQYKTTRAETNYYFNY